MANGVLLHRMDSGYDDLPSSHYHFPKQYLKRLTQMTGDWIVYYVPTKDTKTSKDRRGGYKAIAQIDRITPDQDLEGHYYAHMVEGSFASFPNFVPMRGPGGLFEKGFDKGDGAINGGYAISAVRPISENEFRSIVDYGFTEKLGDLPRRDDTIYRDYGLGMSDDQAPFEYETERQYAPAINNRALRDRSFRKTVIDAYDKTCAITGLRLINGGGRAEVEAAHIRPVEHGGPDDVRNGLALSGTVHWMFDRGLIGLSDEGDIIISRKVNDVSQITALVRAERRAIAPMRPEQSPHPAFLKWHRDAHGI